MGLRAMGFEAYDRAEYKYREGVVRLNAVAAHIVNSDHSTFVRTLADAWLQADSPNKRILRQAWAAIITKYGLEVDLKDEKGEG